MYASNILLSLRVIVTSIDIRNISCANVKHNFLFFSVYREKAERGKIEMIHVVLPFCSKQVSTEPIRFASNHDERRFTRGYHGARNAVMCSNSFAHYYWIIQEITIVSFL